MQVFLPFMPQPLLKIHKIYHFTKKIMTSPLIHTEISSDYTTIPSGVRQTTSSTYSSFVWHITNTSINQFRNDSIRTECQSAVARCYPYPVSARTSGATYVGVPHTTYSVCVASHANPKSPSFNDLVPSSCGQTCNQL